MNTRNMLGGVNNCCQGQRDLIIIGAGGHGKVVADIARKQKKYDNIFFLDDTNGLKSACGISVIGTTGDINKYIKDFDIIVAIGNNLVRYEFLKKLKKFKASIPYLVHPNAVIGFDVNIGYGTVIMAGVVVNSSANIGNGCIINTNSVVEHDSVVEDFCHVSPGVSIAGNSTIGRKTWLGVGSVVIENIKICENCVIGAGSTVIRNINNPGVYVGTPVKKIK